MRPVTIWVTLGIVVLVVLVYLAFNAVRQVPAEQGTETVQETPNQ